VTHRLVALIRGINVGRAKRVAMADLRSLVEGLGYDDVRTLLNSGNVVFSSRGKKPDDAGARIEKGLVTQLGISARVTVLTATEIATVIADNLLLDLAHNHSRLFVAVLINPADRKKLVPLTKQDWAPEALALGARVAYHWCPEGVLASRLAEAIGRALGDGVTTRNWATILKLHCLTNDR
jgi:uncharacterized protein (DUF1697 family)